MSSRIGYRVFFPADGLVFTVSKDEAQILRARHQVTTPSAPIVVAPPIAAESRTGGPLQGMSSRPRTVRPRVLPSIASLCLRRPQIAA